MQQDSPIASSRTADKPAATAYVGEEEGGYEDDFESVASSRLPTQVTAAKQQKKVSPRLESDVEDEVEEEDMDFLLAGLT